jgi:hypothetical protein
VWHRMLLLEVVWLVGCWTPQAQPQQKWKCSAATFHSRGLASPPVNPDHLPQGAIARQRGGIISRGGVVTKTNAVATILIALAFAA